MQPPVLNYASPEKHKTHWAVFLIVTFAGLWVSFRVLSDSQRFRSASTGVPVGRNIAESDLRTLSNALYNFRADCQRYPTAAEGLDALFVAPAGSPGWNGPYSDRRCDPWGNPYLYTAPATLVGSDYRLICTADDGTQGTRDDITATTHGISPARR